jgi:glycosyltransferase involved in cell wall biosynthesis
LFTTPSRRLISIVIPTLNEQYGIEKTITSIPKSTILKDTGFDLEIIVVDGDSTDTTRDIASNLGAKVIIEKRKGYGRACKSGFAAASGEILVVLDADNTYPTECIPNYVKTLISGNLDFISVNRFSCLERGAMNLRRKFGNKLLSFLMRLIYRIDVKDSQSGMWIMKKSFTSQIKPYSDNMSMSEEIKIIAFRNFKAAEVDGKYSARSGSAKLKEFHDGWNNLIYLLDNRRRLKSVNLVDLSSSSFSPSSSKEKKFYHDNISSSKFQRVT